MICKDCVHYDVCNDIVKIHYLVPADELCSTFINKSDYVEMKHGHWIKAQCSEKNGDAHCSECNHFDWSDFNYCSKCGAKMDGERK